jgi:hypothetical protein
MTRKNGKQMKRIVGAVDNGKGKIWWTNIGLAFLNDDGSWNLKFDYLPATPNTTIQVRDFEEKADGKGEDASA